MGDRDQTVYYRLPCSVVRDRGDRHRRHECGRRKRGDADLERAWRRGRADPGVARPGGKIKAAFPAPTDPKLRALQQQVERKELEARLAKAQATIAGGGNASGSEE